MENHVSQKPKNQNLLMVPRRVNSSSPRYLSPKSNSPLLKVKDIRKQKPLLTNPLILHTLLMDLKSSPNLIPSTLYTNHHTPQHQHQLTLLLLAMPLPLPIPLLQHMLPLLHTLLLLYILQLLHMPLLHKNMPPLRLLTLPLRKNTHQHQLLHRMPLPLNNTPQHQLLLLTLLLLSLLLHQFSANPVPRTHGSLLTELPSLESDLKTFVQTLESPLKLSQPYLRFQHQSMLILEQNLPLKSMLQPQ